MVPLDDGDAETLLGSARPVILYKHSPACWLSGRAWQEVEAFAGGRPDVPVFWVDVLRQRPLSRALARRLEVPHASPQVILLERGEPVWDASHMAVARAIERAVDRAVGAVDVLDGPVAR